MDEDSVVMRFKMEGKVDEKQIKREMDSAQKVADANEVQIPTKTKKVNPKDIKEEVESVQKVADKTSVEIPVKLTQKDIENELNKLIKQKGKSQKEVRAKLDDIMKDMDLSDTIKESIKTLFIKYRSIANSTKGFSSASQNSKDEFVKLVEKFSKATGSKKATSMVKVMSNLTSGQAQKYRNEKRTPDQLKQDKQKIIDDVNKERTKQDVAKENLQKARIKEQKATKLVEGSGDGRPSLADNLISEMSKYMESLTYIRSHYTSEDGTLPKGNQKSVDKLEKQLSSVSQRLDAIRTEYVNKDTFVPEAKAELEKVTKNLEALEADAVKRLEEINKLLGPIEKISIDPSNLTPKHYQDIFKKPLPPQKFKAKKRTPEDDATDAAINKDFLRRLRKGASRGEASIPGAEVNLGMRQPVMGGPYVDTKRIIRTARGGPYADTSSYVRSAIETQIASYKLAKKTLQSFIVELNKLQEVINQRNAEINAKAEAEGRKGIAGQGRNKNEVTEQEKNIHRSQITTELAGKEAKKISKGDQADVELFQESLKASFGFLTKSLGPSIWKPLEQNVNRIMANFAGGTFKITDDPVKGEGQNYAALAKLLSENFKDINEFFEQNKDMAKLAEVARQLKAAANVNKDAAAQVLKDFSNFLRKFGYNPGRISTSAKDTTTQKRNESPLTGNTMLSRDVKETNKQLEKNTVFTKMSNVTQEENVETNKANAATGTDSEAGKDEVVEATKDVKTAIEKTSGNNGNGNNTFGERNIGDTGPSILEQIRDLLISINAYTTAIFDLLPKLKLTIKREKRHKSKDDITKVDTTTGKTSLGESMEINKIWDDMVEEFADYIKPIKEAMLPVVAGELKDRTEEAFQAIRDAGKIILQDNTNPSKLRQQQAINEIERTREEAIEKNKQAKYSSVGLSQDVSKTTKTLGDIIKKAFGMTTSTTEIDRIKNLNQEQRERELAQLTKTFGIADRDRNASSTGDKGRAFRMKSVYGYNQKNVNPFKDLKLTPGLEIDSKGITDALQTMIEKNMFSAQTGISGIGDIIKLSFGGIGMPSLEKSRAQADAANEILSIIRQVILEMLQAVQMQETVLRGFEASGDAKFDDKGNMVSGTNEAWAAFGQLEEQKSALNGVIAELAKMDQLSAETGGNMTKFFKVLGFVSPELKKCNTIISNINSGLNKNGKVLKFQSRFQETLNYSAQLLTRYIGQMIKSWVMMLNPISLIKKAFSDFASYDVKWQRTMNVIKYNIRAIIRPFMQWLAQQFVNIIGLANALIKGLGKAFGQKWDLFDQSAANAEKMREELEAAANVTAGFDELHDIGSDNSAAGDLMGDIYTPQWDGLNKVLEDIGETIGKIMSAVSNWNFWDWLKLAGLALVGFLALKALINWFTGKNPLEQVAKGFSFLEKAVGWAILIWAFTSFTKALTDFVECMKSASWEDIVKSLLTLAGAFAALVLAGGGLMFIASALSMLAPQMLALAVVIAAFAPVIWALSAFVEAIKGLTTEDMLNGLLLLAGAFTAIAVAIGVLLVVLSAAIASGVGALAIVALAGIIAVVSLVILALAELVKAMGEAGAGIKLICEGITIIITSVGNAIMGIINTIATGIATVIAAVAEGIYTVLNPILEFIESIIGKVIELAETITHEIGETIRTVIETTGDVIISIIDAIVDAVPDLLGSIVDFCQDIGPAIENTVDAICRSITKLVNFVVSAVEYMANLVIGAINKLSIQVPDWVPGIGGQKWGFNLQPIEIPRFVPKYEQGTNYVPNDGLAYLHQGEAVVPKKYNQPYNPGLSTEEKAYMYQMMNTMKSLDNTMKQGITVNGQFVQRGSDLVAVVNKTKSQTGADLLSNVSYAR